MSGDIIPEMSSVQRLGASLAFVVSSWGFSLAMRRLSSSTASTASAAAAAAANANLSGLRMEYKQRGLEDADAPEDPYKLFGIWIKEAVEAKVVEPNAMVRLGGFIFVYLFCNCNC